MNWALARRHNWSILLRIEDLDGPRIKPGAQEEIVDTLRWLGIDWDSGPIVQSHDLATYTAAMERLARRGLVYPCDLSRAEIEAAASAPNEGDTHEARFPPELRPPLVPRSFDAPDSSWRFATPTGAVSFTDHFAGPQSFDPSASVGDFVVWTKRAQPSYQLAVVVDDHRHAVTQVVRGDDLLDSAARQLLLYRALELPPLPGRATVGPEWTHLPLVVGTDGRRLAKRHGDTRVSSYRALGVAPERLIGLIAFWCGVRNAAGTPSPMTAAEFVARFDPGTMPRSRVVFTEDDHRWLTQRPSPQ